MRLKQESKHTPSVVRFIVIEAGILYIIQGSKKLAFEDEPLGSGKQVSVHRVGALEHVLFLLKVKCVGFSLRCNLSYEVISRACFSKDWSSQTTRKLMHVLCCLIYV